MKTSNYFYGLTKYWWLPLITGLIFIGFGVWCLCAPQSSLPILAYIFAGCIGLVGIFNLFYGLGSISSNHGWGWAVGSGIIEILFSIFLFFIPTELLTYVFIYGIGLYIIFMGIYSFVESFSMSGLSGFWFGWLLLFLLAAIVFACIFILGPATIGWLWIGISFLCYGVFRVLLGCKIRAINETFR